MISIIIKSIKYSEKFLQQELLNLLTPLSDQHRISPYYIYTKSCRQVMRKKKNFNYGITN